MAARKRKTSKKTGPKKAAAAGEVSYVAGKRLRIARDGRVIWINQGDPVPEAAGWRRLYAYLKGGAVIGIVDGEPVRRSRGNWHRLRRDARYPRARDQMKAGARKRAQDSADFARKIGTRKTGTAGGPKSGSPSLKGEGGDEAGKAAGGTSKATAKPKEAKATKPKANKKTENKSAKKGRTRRGG